ncbi:unnamed protein product, partial [Parnassius apollo]
TVVKDFSIKLMKIANEVMIRTCGKPSSSTRSVGARFIELLYVILRYIGARIGLVIETIPINMLFQGPLLFHVFIIFITVCIREALITAQLTSTEVNPSMLKTTPAIQTNTTMYAWSTWGAWSSCSRSCGGGVAVQERQCLPRDPTRWRRSRKRRKLTRSVDHTRRARNVITRSVPDCPGLGRRYHECNTAPCPGPRRDSRADQCAVYDRRPFRGRFYTWVPYVDGNAPCILNCRPRGQQFYASLALVADGTPCTKPGFRAICVQGNCKVSV